MTQEMMKQETNSFNASFQQKSTGVSLVLVGAAGLYTVARLVEMARAEPALQSATPLPDGYWGLLIGVMAFIIVMEIVLQIVLVIGAGGAQPTTARDTAARQKGISSAYWVLASGMMLTIVSMLFSPTPFVMGAILLVTFVLAEVVRLAAQLIFGRAG